MTPVACRYCGKPIVWAISITGARIPLDARAEVYEHNRFDEQGNSIVVPTSQRGVQDDTRPDRPSTRPHMVTHFATCRGASQASADAKAKRAKGASHE